MSIPYLGGDIVAEFLDWCGTDTAFGWLLKDSARLRSRHIEPARSVEANAHTRTGFVA